MTASAGQPYGGKFIITLTPNAHAGLVACLGNRTTAMVTVTAPAKPLSEALKSVAPPAVVTPLAAPQFTVVDVIFASVANAAGAQGGGAPTVDNPSNTFQLLPGAVVQSKDSLF